MIIKKIIGAKKFFKIIFFSLDGITAGFILGITVIWLTGCTPRTVEAPVAVPCPKPAIPTAHDYMADLSNNAGADEFVKACLATRESYKNAYHACKTYEGIK